MASRVLVSPKCAIAAYACATVTAGWTPPYGLDSGSGKAVSTPAGINCTYTYGTESGTCSYTFSWPVGQAGPDVWVRYASSFGSIFCYGSPTCGGPTSALWIVGNLSAGADYEFDISIFLLTEYVSVTRTGLGTGSVTVTAVDGEQEGDGPLGLICSGDTSLPCEGKFDYGLPLLLVATPNAGSAFTQWTGACAGQGATCTITPAGDIVTPVSTNAVFGLASQTTTTRATTPIPTTPIPTTASTPTTTTTATTTTPTTTHATTTTTNPAAVHELEAQLIGIKSGKSKLGFRVEYVEVQAGESVNATLSLDRNGRHLAHTSIPGIRPADLVLTLPIPGSVAKGEATLTITLTDTIGKHRTWTRAINVPT